jgi:hypothetical protein
VKLYANLVLGSAAPVDDDEYPRNEVRFVLPLDQEAVDAFPCELCNDPDAGDLDQDGLVGCLDPDCAPVCSEAQNCDDGLDNDGDALTDCEDPECATSVSCPVDPGTTETG